MLPFNQSKFEIEKNLISKLLRTQFVVLRFGRANSCSRTVGSNRNRSDFDRLVIIRRFRRRTLWPRRFRGHTVRSALVCPALRPASRTRRCRPYSTGQATVRFKATSIRCVRCGRPKVRTNTWTTIVALLAFVGTTVKRT